MLDAWQLDVEKWKHLATRAIASGRHIFTTVVDMLKITTLSSVF